MQVAGPYDLLGAVRRALPKTLKILDGGISERDLVWTDVPVAVSSAVAVVAQYLKRGWKVAFNNPCRNISSRSRSNLALVSSTVGIDVIDCKESGILLPAAGALVAVGGEDEGPCCCEPSLVVGPLSVDTFLATGLTLNRGFSASIAESEFFPTRVDDIDSGVQLLSTRLTSTHSRESRSATVHALPLGVDGSHIAVMSTKYLEVVSCR